MRIALAQLNLTVGDIGGNEHKIRTAYQRGVDAGARIVVCPELSVVGYPPRDLLLRDRFIARNIEAVQRLAGDTGATALLLGFVDQNQQRPGRTLTNSVALLQHGKVIATRAKTLLPTYDVFDEDRYFEPASGNTPVEFERRQIGLTVCEDIWNDQDFWPERRYRANPPVDLALAGAEILFNVSASPWHLGKNRTRWEMLRSLAIKTGRPVVFCNQAGGNDELVFDGASLAFGPGGELLAAGKLFEEDFVLFDSDGPACAAPIELCDEEALFRALTLGLRDYLNKCGFHSAVLGLSGGIDSALTAVIAAEALGNAHVHGVAMPSQYSSAHSLEDARVLARNVGIRYDVIPINDAFESVKRTMAATFAGRAEDTTEENMQARLRGLILMALSNKFGSLVLTTGNKSELAVGYCTLYGDMCGGLAVISDVPKTTVYRLANWINRDREIIPVSSITKAPSAELRLNQRDQDSLPPYELLDAILDLYVVHGKSVADIVASGFDEATVERVIRLIDASEYKRRQAAPGLRVTTKAFGLGRRIPIAQRFRG